MAPKATFCTQIEFTIFAINTHWCSLRSRALKVRRLIALDVRSWYQIQACALDFHIKWALFSKTIAENKVGELEGVSQKDLLVSSENGFEDLKKLSALHKKCLHPPIEVNHLFHSQHPLLLQFNSQSLPCQIFQITQPRELRPTTIDLPCHREHSLVLQLNLKSLICQICHETYNLSSAYYCSACKFGLHVQCVSPAPTIIGEIHEHPFTLFWRQFMKSAFCCNPSLKGFHDMVIEFPTHSSIGNKRSNLGNAKFAMKR
ncbi:C1-like protein [Gossypium australe]|uniref:C1-like protein n=1 Tax=Gossypium australe TaxID=47621 RepID=A0A5B6WKM7_9ROSI|nr:C1-like protein [Gossypium australe]